MTLRLLLTIFIAKCVTLISRIAGHRGTTVGGTIALRLNPMILKSIKKKFKHVIFVTGTNGKTTTSNVLANIIKKSGQSVVHNKEGANMLTGVTACLVQHADLTGRVAADWAILEVDEGSLPQILKQMWPDKLVVLNFFRDQLDRYGEIDVLIKKMKEALRPTDVELILNADDPLVMQFDQLNQTAASFGIHRGAVTFGQFAQGESVYCPDCGEEMTYSSTFYGQLGDYSCQCGFKRPEPTYEVDDVQTTDQQLSFTIAEREYQTTLKGSFNLYNIAAAISAAFESGMAYEAIQKGLSEYSLNNGRMETFYHQGTPYILNLNKNPSGTNVIINELISNTQPKQLLMILNDNVADGEDISWIWDVNFEALQQDEIEKVICSGSRSSELVLRFKYADVPIEKIVEIPEIDEAIEYVLKFPLHTYILPTYTALSKAKEGLTKRVQTI